MGLNTACQLARGEYILGIDGDALVDADAIAWMLHPMLGSERIGAVTGNPRIRTRTTLLGRMQVGEFSSIIGSSSARSSWWARCSRCRACWPCSAAAR